MSNVIDIHVDIECIPSQRPTIMEHLSRRVPDTMSMEEAEIELDRLFLRTSLDGALGEIVSVAAAVADHEPRVWYRPLPKFVGTAAMQLDPPQKNLKIFDDEKSLLLAFRADMLKATEWAKGRVRLCGLNVREFDRPYIVQRGMAHGLWMPVMFTREIKPWETHELAELMTIWTGSHRGRVSLNDLCFALGLDGKGDVDGKSVWTMMQEGRHHEVAIYNASDVVKSRACLQRMMNLE